MAKHRQVNQVRLNMGMPFGGHLRVLDDSKHKRLVIKPMLGKPPEPSPEPSK
jgi:hypothetical protein